MAIVVALVGRLEASSALWNVLVEGLPEPRVEAKSGPARAAVFEQHRGERIEVPGPAPAEPGSFVVGFGGDGGTTAPEQLVPPWMRVHWDARARQLVVECDRHGFALGYWRKLDGAVAFSTSAARLGRLPPELPRDPIAIAELVAFDHLLGTRTLRRGVTAIPYGHRLTIDESGVKVARTFSYSDLPRERTTARRAARSLIAPWKEAVARAAASRGTMPIVVTLSGGLDSRLLAATAAELGAPTEAYTFARASEGESAPDASIARTVASSLGIPWRFAALEDDWLADFAAVAASLTDGQLDLVHSHGISIVDTVPEGALRFDGLAGDVVLGGSFLTPKLWRARGPTARHEALWRARSRIRAPFWRSILVPAAASELVDRARASLVESLREVEGDDRWSDFWTLAHRIRRFTVNGTLLWQSRVRSVFLFFAPAFLDRLLATPPELRFDSGVQAPFFHAMVPRMAKIPWQKTGRPLAPSRLAERVQRWLREPELPPNRPFFDFDSAVARSPRLVAFLRDRLLDPRTGVARFGCFDRAGVERLLASVAAGQGRGMAQLGPLLTLVLAEDVWAVRAAGPARR